MESTWPQSYPYHPYNPTRSDDRPHGTSPTLEPLHPHSQSHSHSPEDSHRRPQTYPHQMNYLPHQSLPSISTYQHHSYPYPPYVPYPPSSSPTSLLSPYPQARQPPPHSLPYESPRLPHDVIPTTAYPTSPNPTLPHHHISPSSPPAHLAPPHIKPDPSASSTSPYAPPQHNTRGSKRSAPRKRLSGSGSPSADESWEDDSGPGPGHGSGKKAMIHLSGTGGMYDDGLDEVTEEQPWGMPQHLYKDLNPKDKKQVRNKIGARRFRAKKKAHIQNLEHNNRALLIELAQLRRANNIFQAEHTSSLAARGMPPSPMAGTVVRRLTDDKGNVLGNVDVDALEGMGGGLGLSVRDGRGDWEGQ